MAKIISHVPLIISGKLGDRIYYLRNGKNFSRKLPVRKEKIYPEPMQPQQQKFSLLGKILNPLSPLFRSTFKRHTHDMSGINRALSSNFRNGFIEEYPPYNFDFSNLLLGDGFVANAKLIVVKSNEPGTLTFYWMGTIGRDSARNKDHLYVAVFCEALKTWIYETHAAFRIAGTCTIDVRAFSENAVHVYAGFISMYGKDASRSEYLGMVNIL
jgi:Family of unknown function (DUF6266)